MNLQAVSSNLEARISAGREWLESTERLVFKGPVVRKCTTSIRLAECLDTPKRIERYGLGFVVTMDAPERPLSFQINIRIKSDITSGPKIDSYPYVVSYLVNQVEGAELLICFDHIVEPKSYASAVGLTVQEWYLRWLELALDRGDGKLFTPEVRIPM